MPTTPEQEEIPFVGRIVARTGFKDQFKTAGLISGELGFATDAFYGAFGDESSSPPLWPTSKSTGEFEWSYTPKYKNIKVETLNGKTISEYIKESITVGDTPVLQIINDRITKTVFGSGADFADLSQAFIWLSQRTISASGFVTLQLAKGTFNVTSSLFITHPNGNRIAIIGSPIATPLPKNADYQITGYSPAQRAADTAVNLALLKQSYTTVINMLNGSSINITGNLNNMQDILVISDGSIAPENSYTSGIVVSYSRSNFTRMAICGFQYYNFYVYSGNVDLTENFVTFGGGLGMASASQALIGLGTQAQIGVFSNRLDGIQATSGSFVCLSYNNIYAPVRAAGNGSCGLLVATGVCNGTITLLSELNGNQGIAVLDRSSLNLTGAIVRNNGNNSVYVVELSNVSFTQLNASGPGTGVFAATGSFVTLYNTVAVSGTVANYSPALGTTGNRNSQIANG